MSERIMFYIILVLLLCTEGILIYGFLNTTLMLDKVMATIVFVLLIYPVYVNVLVLFDKC